jgi:hypothetical protein
MTILQGEEGRKFASKFTFMPLKIIFTDSCYSVQVGKMNLENIILIFGINI